MADTLEKWEQDRIWLLSQRPEATEDQVDQFCESVAKRWIDTNDEDQVRIDALGES